MFYPGQRICTLPATPELSAVEIELPGLERVQSAAAVPLLAHGELTGVLYLESEREGDFSPGKERLLRIPRWAARRRARGAGGGSRGERPERVRAGDERIDLSAGDYCFAPRDIPHTYIVRSERARMLTTLSPAGLEELFVTLGVPVTDAEPPTEEVLPPMRELVRLFAGYGCEIVGPPPSLSDLS